jgi:hypothetical protein
MLVSPHNPDKLTLSAENCKHFRHRTRLWALDSALPAGCRAMNNAKFGKEVKRAFPQSSKRQARHGRTRLAIYKDLAVMDGSEVAINKVHECQHWQ